MEVRRLCTRKEELYAALAGNHKPPVVPGVPLFLETLVKHNVSLSGLPQASSCNSLHGRCRWLQMQTRYMVNTVSDLHCKGIGSSIYLLV